MKILYRLHSIRKCYGSNVALDIESVTIGEGRLYTLTGANGAGKSTLLSILAFLALAPDVRGNLLRREAGRLGSRFHVEYRRKVTLLHQSPYLFSGSVHDNVAFGLKCGGIQGKEQRRIVDRALDGVGFRGSVTGRPGSCPAARCIAERPTAGKPPGRHCQR